MKRPVFVITLIALTIVLLNSCEYEPKGVFNQFVDKNISPPQIQIVQLNLDSANIYIHSSLEVDFQFNTNNQTIKATRILIDGIQKSLIYSNKGEFHIFDSELSEGLHKLVIEVYTGSGTGSIADKLGMEGFVAFKSWNLYVDKSSFHPEIKTSVVNGLLNITWTPYHASNFMGYMVCRWDNTSPDDEIARTMSNVYVDNSYVGEGGRFSIKVLTTDGSYFTLGDIDLPQESFPLKTYCERANLVNLKLTRGKYYNAIDSFEIFMGPSEFYSEWVGSIKGTDSVYQTTSSNYCEPLYFKVRIVPKKGNVNYVSGIYDKFESSLQTWTGHLLKPKFFYFEFAHASKDEFLYTTDCDSIVRYSVTQRKIIEKIGDKPSEFSCCEFMNLRVSPSGKYLTTSHGCEYDPLFTRVNSLSPFTLIGRDKLPAANGGLPVSDIGTALYSECMTGIHIYDLINLKEIGTYITDYSCPEEMKISSNGDYFFTRDDTLRLISFKNLQFKILWKATNVSKYGFSPVNSNEFMLLTGNTLTIKRCDNLATVSELNLTEDLLDIDYYNNEILTYLSGHLYVRRMADGSLIHDIPMYVHPSDYPRCLLVNHTIINNDGILYFL